MEWVRKLCRKVTIKEVIRRVRKDPGRGIMRLIKTIKPFVTDPWHKEVVLMASEGWADRDKLEAVSGAGICSAVSNSLEVCEQLHINSALIGNAKTHELSAKYERNVPWAILMDPPLTVIYDVRDAGRRSTKGDNLSYDELDDIIRQGKELGIYMYLYSGENL